jgi:CubicO group peptidase (beta-lactamase class C family)/chromosome segregation ATPase
LHTNPAFAGPPDGVFRARRKRSKRASCRRFPATLLLLLAGVTFGAWGLTATDPAGGRQTLSQWHGRWYAASPRALGFDPVRLSDTITSIGKMPGVYGFLLVRDGYLVSERYWREGTRSKPHNIKSASKSVISALVGIAIDKGYFGLDQPIVELLPKAAKLFDDPLKKKITVRHLLTMRSGLEPASYQAYNVWIASRDWVKEALHGPLRSAPGASYHYSTANTHLLSVILAETTGGSTRSFAEKMLFGPMDIQVHGWQKDPTGVHVGGNNLSLVPRDLAKFGQLYLDGGRWGNRQLVSRSWIEASTHPTKNGPHATYGTYGFLWWVQPPDQGSFAAVGYGGQYVLVSPRHDAVVIITSTLESKGRPWEAKLFKLLRDGVLGSLVDPSMPPAVLAATTTSNVNLRARPSLNGRQLQMISKGRQVELLRREGDWVLGQIDGKQGWLRGDFIDRLSLVSERKTVALALNSAVEGAPAPEAAPGVTSGGGSQQASQGQLAAVQTDLLDASPDEADATTAAVRASSAAVDSELLALRDQLDRLGAQVAALNGLLGGQPALPKYRTTRRLNFRSSPGRKAKRIRVLDATTEFQALDRTGPWLKVRIDGVEGWVHSEYARTIDSTPPVLDRGDLAANLSALTESVRELDDAQKRRKSELDASRSEIARLEGALAQEQGSRQRLTIELARLSSKSQTQQAEFTETENRNTQMLELANSRITRLESRIAQATADREAIDRTSETSRAQMAKLEGSLNAAQASKRALSAELEQLRDESQAHQTRLSEAEKKRAQELEAAKPRIATLDSRAEQAVVSRNEINQALASSRGQVAKLEGALGDAQASKRVLVSEIETLRAESRAQLTRFSEAEKRRAKALASSGEQVAKLESWVQQVAASRKEIDKALAASRAQVLKLDSTLGEARVSSQALAAELEGLRQENQAQRARFDEADKQRTKELAASNTRVAELEGLFDEAAADRKEIDQALAASRSRVVRLEDTLTETWASERTLAAELEALAKDSQAQRVRFEEAEKLRAQALQASTARVATLESRVEQAAASRKQTDQALEPSRARVVKLEAVLAKEQTFNLALATQLEALRKDSQAQRARFEKTEKQRTRELEAGRLNLSKLEAQVEQLAASRKEVDRVLEASRGQVATLEGTLGKEQASRLALAAQLEAFRKDGEAQRAQFDEVEKQLAQALEASRSNIARLETRVEQAAASREKMAQGLKASRAQVAELEVTLGDSQASRQALTAELDGVRRQNQAQRLQFDESEKQRAQALDASRAHIATLESRIDAAAASREEIDQALKVSRVRVAKLESALGDSQASGQGLAAELEGLRQENQAQRAQLSEAEKQRAQTLEESRSRVTKLEGTLGEARASELTLATALEGLRVESQAQRARFEQAEKQRALEFETRRKAIDQALAASRGQVARLEDKLVEARSSRETLATELEGLRRENNTQRIQFSDVEKQRARAFEASRAEVAELRSTLQQEQVSRQALVADLTGLRKENASQRVRLDDVEEQRAGDLEAGRAQIAELESALNRQQASRQTLVTELAGLRGEIQTQRAQLENAGKQRTRELEAARSRSVALEAKLDLEKAARQALVAEFDGLRNEIRTQRAQLEDVEKLRARELEIAHAQIDVLEFTLRRERSAKETLFTQSRPLPEAGAGGSADPAAAQLFPVPAGGAPSPAEPVAFSWAPGVDAFVRAWAGAWSQQAVDDYLGHYSADFQPADGSVRAVWAAQRRKRLRRPKFIEVEISDMQIESLDANRARATFRQAYRADRYHDVVVKVLDLARDGGRWWIVGELAR